RKYQLFQTVEERLGKLEGEIARLRAIPKAAPPAAAPLADPAAGAVESRREGVYTRAPIDPGDFYFRLQGHFQSSEPGDIARLEMYRSVLEHVEPELPAAPWLDIGYGRGKWLRL